jgi:hypothetical protein
MNMMLINFLLQAIRAIHTGNYNVTGIEKIYDYLITLDNITLNDYFNSHSVLQYNNDLEFCVEVIDRLMKVLEEKEEYEKCQVLLDKKEESLDIMKINIDEYEHT